MNDMIIWNSHKEVPEQYKKLIKGGRLKGKTDIRPQWRLMALTELFGPCGVGWYYETIERWTDEANQEVSAHVRINLFVKQNEEWSKGIEGQGGSMLLAKETAGYYHSDEAYKMATTDAISVACKQLGIGSDVYMGEKTKHDKTEPTTGSPEDFRRIQLDRIDKIRGIDDGYRASLISEVNEAADSKDPDKAGAARLAIQEAERGN